jgi:putative ABC transport system substrate-binding protein
MAGQAAQLLDGVPVAETPVQDPGEFELVLNLRAAERLGLTIPAAFVERADRVVR